MTSSITLSQPSISRLLALSWMACERVFRDATMNKAINHTGKRFHKLTVTKRVENGHSGVRWECLCDCGNTITVYSSSLGQGKSCGCLRHAKLEDFTGMRFGNLVALSRASNGRNKQTRWLCQCNCGEQTVVCAQPLKEGNTTTCGCRGKLIPNRVGQKIGLLTVISRSTDEKGYGVLWNCKCDCGAGITVAEGDFGSMDRKSCGCLRGTIKDITGQTFGRLTVISRSENSKHGQSRWNCRCVCGNETVVDRNNLASGGSKSCGCLITEGLKGRLISLIGLTFGRLTVISESPRTISRSKWTCKCSCGNVVSVTGLHLRNGHTRSCGCIAKDRVQHEDLNGKQIRKWTVLRRGPNTARKTLQWFCQHEDGHIRLRGARSLQIEADPFRYLMQVCRQRVGQFFKNRSLTKTSSTAKMLGCSGKEFAEHLQKQFNAGMSFFNFGEWQIDHIIPLASAKTIEELNTLLHYSNTQPLWAEHNLSKGCKLNWSPPPHLSRSTSREPSAV